nr:MAG TPA: apocytochrome F [Microviridae sp.]
MSPKNKRRNVVYCNRCHLAQYLSSKYWALLF